MEHTLSQFGKTTKKALKPTTKKRQLLCACPAIQRFPVVKWRQQTEDFHKRSINASCRITGADAWRKTDGDVDGMAPIQYPRDWDLIQQEDPTRPAWDQETLMPCAQRERQSREPRRWTTLPYAAPPFKPRFVRLRYVSGHA